MGKISAEELSEKLYNNYRAIFEDDVFEYHAVSVRQAWYLAFEHFGDECVDYLAEIDQNGDVVDVILDKEDVY
jgi:hypothetical protein